MSSTVLKVENLSYLYAANPVLQDISFSLFPGDYAVLSGPNGAGKSTLLKIILGLIKPSSGRLYLWDQPIASFQNWSDLGYIPQKLTQTLVSFPATVQELLLFGLGQTRLKAAAKNDLIDQTLSKAGVFHLKKRLLSDLSGGERQRVFMARCLILSPKFLVLDEPTVGVDTPNQQAFLELLANINRQDGVTILLVTHDVGFFAKDANRLLCLDQRLSLHQDFQLGMQDLDTHYLNLYGQPNTAHHHSSDPYA